MRSRWMAWVVGGLALIVLAVSGFLVARHPTFAKSLPDSPERSDEPSEAGATSVKAIQPRRDPAFSISVQQLLSVEPFFETGLKAQVAGAVRYVHKAIGDSVKRGELLVELDVPHLTEEVAAREAAIRQRQRDVELARALVENAQAAAEVAKETIDLRKAEVLQAGYTRDYRQKRWARYTKLAKGDGVLQNVVDEEERDYLSAEAGYRSAEVAVRKASADYREKTSAVRAAEADVELKRSWVDLARKERDRAAALANYARITAPFDGVITQRTVDMNAFVPNASTGSSEPVMKVARTDLLTVVMRVPDNAAPFVTVGTEAVMQFDELPGAELRGVVSRFAPAIRGQDRTMRVEVDVFNGTRVEYERFLATNFGAWLAPLAAHGPAELTNLLIGADSAWQANSKGERGTFPVCVLGTSLPREKHLIQGMSGYMRLKLKQFQDACLVPSGVVYTKGGSSYILLVKEGVTQEMPARVQVDDGRVAKIAVVTQAADPARGLREVLRDLTPEDTLVLNRQVEVGTKRTVKVTLENW